MRYPFWSHIFISPYFDLRTAVVSYWRKYVHLVLVIRLGGLSLARNCVVRVTGRPDKTIAVYCRRNACCCCCIVVLRPR